MRCAIVLACCAAACGRLGFDAAARDDAGADAAPLPDAPPGTVTVHVLGIDEADNGLPAPGVSVVFDSGGVQTVRTTDAAGIATLDVMGATDVHVVRMGGSATWSVTSFFHLGGGDDVTSGGDGLVDAQDTMTLNVLPEPAATNYFLGSYARCIVEGGGQTASFAAAFATSCAGESVPIYVTAETPGGREWLAQPAALTAGGSANLGGTWQPATTHAIHYLHVPDGIDVAATLYHRAGSDVLELGSAQVDSAGGGAELAIEAMGAPDFVVSQLGIGETVPVALVFDSYPLAADTFDVDRVPAPLAASVTAAPLRIAWDVPAGAPYDLVLAGTGMTRPDTTTILWRAYAPPELGAVTYPTLPPALAAANMPAGTTLDTSAIGSLRLGAPYATGVAHIDRDLAHLQYLMPFGPGAVFILQLLTP